MCFGPGYLLPTHHINSIQNHGPITIPGPAGSINLRPTAHTRPIHPSAHGGRIWGRRRHRRAPARGLQGNFRSPSPAARQPGLFQKSKRRRPPCPKNFRLGSTAIHTPTHDAVSLSLSLSAGGGLAGWLLRRGEGEAGGQAPFQIPPPHSSTPAPPLPSPLSPPPPPPNPFPSPPLAPPRRLRNLPEGRRAGIRKASAVRSVSVSQSAPSQGLAATPRHALPPPPIGPGASRPRRHRRAPIRPHPAPLSSASHPGRRRLLPPL